MTTWSVDVGLFDNDVYQILEDASENRWMCCTKGIFRVAKRQLDEFAGGSIPRLSCVSWPRQRNAKRS